MPAKTKDETTEEKKEVKEEMVDEYEVLHDTTIGPYFFDEGDIIRVEHGTKMTNTNLAKKGTVAKPHVDESIYFDPTTI